jgi:DNA repair protein RecN (Recombination protein N)
VIEELWIRNLGVIGDATLPLGPGFTVVSGETGAGKTMVVTALGLLLGERADSGAIRAGAEQAVAEGRWLVPTTGPVADRVDEAGGSIDEVGAGRGELILSRSISPEGRSRATVGGRSAPVGALADIGQQLVVVHGQSDQLRLKSATAQREALDRFGGPDLARALTAYRDVYERFTTGRVEYDTLIAERDARTVEAEQLRSRIDEIEGVAPTRGEDAELGARIDRLSSLEELRLASAQAHEALSAENSEQGIDAVTLLDGARRGLERVSDKDAELAPITLALSEASYLVSDLAAQLAGYLAGLDADGARELDQLEERRSSLLTLARQYGSLDEAIDFLDTGSARLLELDNDSTRIDALAHQLEADLIELLAVADALTRHRHAAGQRLAEGVTAELAALAMPQARLHVDVTETEEFHTHGRDSVQLLLQPHAGAEPRVLGKGASGGELSRVMLALEVVIAGSDPVPTFVFDEVDAGVGGASAIEIGRRLARLAESAQVIVVTHLAQVAAFAGNHLRVSKDSDGSVTSSTVTQLSGEDRVAEMARLLSGLPDSESGLAHARELLDLATAS